jgi:hypothetical protein
MIYDSKVESDDTKQVKIRRSQSRPLFKKLESEYKANVLLPEFNKVKEILKERKDFMNPIKFKDKLRRWSRRSNVFNLVYEHFCCIIIHEKYSFISSTI